MTAAETAKPLVITLKNIKYAAFASEETACFEATIYLDGVKAGTVHNEGRGGPHSFEPWELETRLDEYGKTLPKKTYDDIPGEEFEHGAESLINVLLDDYLLDKDLKRALKNKFLFVHPETNRLMEFKPQKRTVAEHLANPQSVANLKEMWKTGEILNLMPYDEAKTLYKTLTQ